MKQRQCHASEDNPGQNNQNSPKKLQMHHHESTP